MRTTTKLRELLQKNKFLAIPGCYDCFSARVIEKIGFNCAYITGYGIEATKIGKPDIGLTSMSEVVEHAGNISSSVEIPVICDADTGFGGVLNVIRTVRLFQKFGIAGIHLEDQVIPKKCGGLSGKQNVMLSEMLGRIKAAKEAIDDKDFVIIARSDAKAMGIDEVKRRFHAFLEEGADLVMIGDRYTVEELRDLAGEFRGLLMISAGFAGCEEMNLSADEYSEMGVKIAIYPIVGLGAAGKALQEIYKPLLENGQITNEQLYAKTMTFNAMNRTLDLENWLEYEKKYSLQME